jgi:hypothetical protein
LPPVVIAPPATPVEEEVVPDPITTQEPTPISTPSPVPTTKPTKKPMPIPTVIDAGGGGMVKVPSLK